MPLPSPRRSELRRLTLLVALCVVLFFSGHTSLPFLLFLVARDRGFRIAFLLLTLATGTCVIVQHVHYTIDVVVAPFVAYGCFRGAVQIRMATKAW